MGVVISAGVVAGGLIYLMDWPAASALVFAALISAIDPVAIIAMFKERRAGRLRLLVEGESLLNDAAAAVLFALALAFALASGQGLTGTQMIWDLARIVVGGALIGTAFGVAVIFAARGTGEHLVELTLTVLAAYGSFLVAEYFHDSGVLAAVTAGLIIGNFLSSPTKRGDFLTEEGPRVHDGLLGFRGLCRQFVGLPSDRGRASPVRPTNIIPGRSTPVSSAITLPGARAISVYPLAALFSRSRWRITYSEKHVLVGGGPARRPRVGVGAGAAKPRATSATKSCW